MEKENKSPRSERSDRIKKIEELKELNINPYPAKSKRTFLIKKVLEDFDSFKKEERKLNLTGRLKSKRSHGNLTFAQLEDRSAKIQIAFSKKEIGVDKYEQLTKLIDIGDFLEVKGACFVTHKGENSLMISDWKLLSKAIRPLPDKWRGFRDEEEKLRKRYLDILINKDIRDMVEKKAKFWNSVREFLMKEDFLEVETPVLETTTGGADARPFETKHNALDINVYLRISMGELWQKRLMVAGLEKTFEIGRQFRNEGMDAEHLQDYTQMEFYWAYADYEDGMKLVEQLFKHVAKETFGTLKFKIRDFDIDLEKKWEKYDYRKTVKKYTKIDILNTTEKEIKAKLDELKVDYDKKGFNITRAIDNLWKYCRKQIAGPGFLVGVPKVISPLAKTDPENTELTLRFQPIIAGSELGNGYSELNDPLDQAKRFKAQQKLRDEGDDEAQMYDNDYVEALEYGMPPTCGFGMSERVFSFLMGKSMRECQIFPLMKPKYNLKGNTGYFKLKPGELKGEVEKNLGINHKDAKKLLNRYIKDENTKFHMIETEVIMRTLAKHFSQDEERWGIIGLLHDIDWELTKDNTDNHGIKMKKIIKEAGGTDFLIETIQSHVYGFGNVELKDKKRTTTLQHALAASETLTGLIIASALMQPDKKLASVKLGSLKKKFKNSKFAANCNRDIIMECEKIDIPIDDFLELSLKALQGISDELSL